jgi:hypothetical protein
MRKSPPRPKIQATQFSFFIRFSSDFKNVFFSFKILLFVLFLVFGKISPSFRYHKIGEKTKPKKKKKKKKLHRTTPLWYYVIKMRKFSTHFALTLFWAFEHRSHSVSLSLSGFGLLCCYFS